MRSRTIKEGSVGLLIITGILSFAAIGLWLRGIKLGERNYDVIAEFPDIKGVQVGDPVRYRGLKVGRVKDILPGTNGVEAIMEMDSSKLLIPKDVTVKTSSSGLIGETYIDIQPPPQEVIFKNSQMSPFGQKCEGGEILCNGEKVTGISGITTDDLFPLMYKLSSRLAANPELFNNVSDAAENAAVAAGEIAQLSQDFSALVKDIDSDLDSFTEAANTISSVAGDASNQINDTALKYQETATKLNKLVDNANSLVSQNRDSIITTLDSIGQTSDRLQSLIVTLDSRIEETDTKNLIANLETLTANAADASENLKDISETFADPDSVVTLQQTLDSARVTFANAQKITADLEEVTGDPSFRNNFRNLVNGLSNLVSSTEQLEQQIYTDRVFQDLQQFSNANLNQRAEQAPLPLERRSLTPEGGVISDSVKQQPSTPNLQKQAKPQQR